MERNQEVSDYTNMAYAAIRAAAEHEHDFGGWLSALLARTAAALELTAALTAGRPG